MKKHSLKKQFILSFCLYAVFISVCFGLLSFLFLYFIEDEFLNADLNNEAQYLIKNYEKNGQWQQPRKQHMTIYLSPVDFPDDLKETFQIKPDSEEFFGEQGRHYHLVKLRDNSTEYLVAEESGSLVVRQVRKGIVIVFGFFALILTAFACLLAYVLARRTISPLSQLANFVQGTNPEKLPNDFSINYPNNEIGVLARALESALTRISKFIQRESHFNRDVSHDLRTPIAIVQGSTELLLASEKLCERDKQLVERINSANRQMSQIVQTLLELAREEHANQIEWVPLLPVVEKIVVQYSSLLKNKNVELDIKIDSNTKLLVSHGVLDILLSNLISNSFQYTEQGKVVISCSNNIMSIMNTAPSIDNEMLEPLVKGKNSNGFGLGLSIVKRLCEHHQLKLEITQKDLGVCISIVFPTDTLF